MNYIAPAILLLLSLIAYVFLIAFFCPKLILKPSYSILDIKDRGIKKYVFPTGRAISYQPGLNVRPYINSYVLSCHEGEKILQCKLSPEIASIQYDVVVFDANDAVMTVLQVSQTERRAIGITRAVILPADTAYVHLVLRKVNNAVISQEATACYTWTRVFCYFLASIVMTAAELIFLKWCLIRILTGVLSMAEPNYFFTFWTAALVGAVYAWITFLLHRSKDTRVVR